MLTCNTVFGDLFTAPDGYKLVQCISADFEMGAGIAVQFNKRFNMKNRLLTRYPNGVNNVCCILEGDVFNLVTKMAYYEKPGYDDMEYCLQEMFRIMKENDIHQIAMPRIGSGLDKLEFGLVYGIVKDVLSDIDYDVDLLIYIN